MRKNKGKFKPKGLEIIIDSKNEVKTNYFSSKNKQNAFFKMITKEKEAFPHQVSSDKIKKKKNLVINFEQEPVKSEHTTVRNLNQPTLNFVSEVFPKAYAGNPQHSKKPSEEINLNPTTHLKSGFETENKLNYSPFTSSNKNTISIEALKQIDIPVEYCTVCFINIPLRGKHCSSCNKCIPTFDHHCSWVGTCVGEANKRIYFFFLISQIAEIIVYLAYVH